MTGFTTIWKTPLRYSMALTGFTVCGQLERESFLGVGQAGESAQAGDGEWEGGWFRRLWGQLV